MAPRFVPQFLVVLLLLAPLRADAGWIDVPFIAQRENGCGASVTAMVMQYWGGKGFGVSDGASQAPAIYESLYSAEARGILGSHIETYLRQHGFEPYVFEGRWGDLAWHITRGRPLIVCVRDGGPSAPLHYLVVAGLEEEQDIVLVNDPARRKLTRIGRQSFQRSWKESGNWTLLALPQRP